MVLERLGFVYEGTERQAFWVGEVCTDNVNYGLLPDEWRSWTSRPLTRPEVVELVELDSTNDGAYRRLATHKSQERFVSPVIRSFADALLPDIFNGTPLKPWFRGIAADGEPAGFVMVAEATNHFPEPYLWRLLVDRRHQRRGIGHAVLDQLVDRCRVEGHRRLTVSWGVGKGSPEPLYLRYGFRPTGEMDGDEIVGALDL